MIFNNYLLLAESPLTINPINILLHLLNLAILVAGLWFLLFKPVKRFIKRRNENISKIVDENNKLNAEIESKKNEYEVLILEAKKELSSANEKALVMAKDKTDLIIDKAEKQAKEIIAKTHEENEAERARMLNDVKKQVAQFSVAVANKILEREISEKDNTKIIEEALKSWTN